MRVMRGKTFEGKKGVWEKIEVELDSTDLLPEELEVPKSLQLQLLEIRADRNLVIFLERHGHLSSKKALEHIEALDSLRKKILTHKPKPSLKMRSAESVE